MSDKNNKKRTVAIGIAALGVAGLAISAAATLNLTWSGVFDAGKVDVTATCQGETEVNVGFSDVDFVDSLDVPWAVNSLNFSGIEEGCEGLSYEVAVKTEDGGTWNRILELGAVPAGGEISVPLDDVDAFKLSDVAFTIFN